MSQLHSLFLSSLLVFFPLWQAHAQDSEQEAVDAPADVVGAELNELASPDVNLDIVPEAPTDEFAITPPDLVIEPDTDMRSLEDEYGLQDSTDILLEQGSESPSDYSDSDIYTEQTDTPLEEPVQAEPVTDEAVVEDNTVAPTMAKQERARSLFILVASILLIIALTVVIVILLKRGRFAAAEPAAEEFITEAYLQDLYGHTQQATYKLSKKSVMLGRVAGTQTDLLDYLVIPQSTVGRRHALIEYKDYGFWIKDQGSINGTFINDRLINAETRLKHGDKVRLHKYEFEFIIPDMAGDAATVVSAAPAADFIEEADADAAEAAKPGDEFFDISGGLDQAEVDTVDASGMVDSILEETAGGAASQDETLLPGDSDILEAAEQADDETLLPVDGDNNAAEMDVNLATLLPEDIRGDDSIDSNPQLDEDGDETLMPGDLDDASEQSASNEEETILPGDEIDAGSPDNFVDIGLFDEEKKE